MNVNRIDGTTETIRGDLADLLNQANERLAEPDVTSVEIFKNPAHQYPDNRKGRRAFAAQMRRKSRPQPQKKRKKGKR